MATITNKQSNPVVLGEGKVVLLPIRGYVRKLRDKEGKELSEVRLTGLNDLTDAQPNFPKHATHAWVQLPEDASVVLH